MNPSQSRILGTQYSSLPDDFLNDVVDSNAQPVTGKSLWEDWNPAAQIFNPSKHWAEALETLKVPKDRVHMGIENGSLASPFSSCNVGLLKEGSKAAILCLQILDVLKNQELRARDMTGEIICSVHPDIGNQYNFVEGIVILVQNVTVLPGANGSLVLNITPRNLVKVFQDDIEMK